jgi:hypothetical protein
MLVIHDQRKNFLQTTAQASTRYFAKVEISISLFCSDLQSSQTLNQLQIDALQIGTLKLISV